MPALPATLASVVFAGEVTSGPLSLSSRPWQEEARMKTLPDGSVCRRAVAGQQASLLPRPLLPTEGADSGHSPRDVPLQ